MGQDHVGILLNSGMYRGIPQRKTGRESISNYEESARKFGLIPCFLRLGDIDLKQGTSMVYMLCGFEYIKKTIPTPYVIHNRALYQVSAARRRINSLASQGTYVFNMYNRYGKDVIHRLLSSAHHLRKYLPETIPAKPSGLRYMMSKHNDLILKPVQGSVGRGVMRMKKGSHHWELYYSSSMSSKRYHVTRLRHGNLPMRIRKQIFQVPYLIQERIPLVEYYSKAVDLRVTVQRGFQGEWGITGMFAKAAPQGSFVSNIGKGGGAYPVKALLAAAMPPYLIQAALAEVEYLALSVAKYLSSHLPLLADLGLDIGITSDGRPYFIECNGRDQRYGFREAQMMEEWKNTYHQPMAYARYLLDQTMHDGTSFYRYLTSEIPNKG